MVNGFHNNEQALMMVSTLELNFPQQFSVQRTFSSSFGSPFFGSNKLETTVFINTTNRLEYHDPQRVISLISSSRHSFEAKEVET